MVLSHLFSINKSRHNSTDSIICVRHISNSTHTQDYVCLTSLSQLVVPDVENCMNFEVTPPFDQSRRVISNLDSRLFSHWFWLVEWSQEGYSPFSKYDGLKPMFSDKLSRIHCVCVVSILNSYLFSPLENSRVYVLKNGLCGEKIKTNVLRYGVPRAHSFNL